VSSVGQILDETLLSQQPGLREAVQTLGNLKEYTTMGHVAIGSKLFHMISEGVNLRWTFMYSGLGRGLFRK